MKLNGISWDHHNLVPSGPADFLKMKRLRVKRDISIQSGPCQATKPRYGRTLQPAQKLLLTSTDEAMKMSRTQKTIFDYSADDLKATVRDLDQVNSSRDPWKRGRQVNI